MSILDTYVSIYNGVTDKEGRITFLSNFLGSKRHKDRILRLRAEQDADRKKAMKLSLPQAAVSGVFHPTRKVEHLQCHSGFLCVDLDWKDNQQYSIDEIRKVLCTLPYVAYAALSVSGNGMFGIIPIAHTDRHGEHFDALKKEFYDNYGLTLDKACRDVTRLRALSYDPDPYVNEDACIYEDVILRRNGLPDISSIRPTSYDNDLRKVQKCVDMIEQHGIDITGSYEDWFRVGASLTALGEEGRYFFHKVSSQYPDYKYADADRMYTQLLRSTKSIGIGTFLYWCQQYGITYKEY